jgi:hypothetical protein
MSRTTYQLREAVVKKKTLHPAWRGVGFIILVLLTIGGFWLAGYLLELNWQQPFLPWNIPRDFTIQVADWAPAVSGKLIVQIVAALVLDVFGYAAMVVLYALLFPIRPGDKDAPQPRGRGRRSLVR